MKHLIFLRDFLLYFLLALSVSTLAYSGNKKIVAIVDTGLNLNDERFKPFLCDKSVHRDFTGHGIEDQVGHGTHITGIITQSFPSNFCIAIIKYYDYNYNHQPAYRQAMNYISELKPAVVNLSVNGGDLIEEEALAVLRNPKTQFVIAAGNQGLDISVRENKMYPQWLSKTFNNVRVVGSLTPDEQYRSNFSNYGLENMYWEKGEKVKSYCVNHTNVCIMSGTSQAAAIQTNKLVKDLNNE